MALYTISKHQCNIRLYITQLELTGVNGLCYRTCHDFSDIQNISLNSYNKNNLNFTRKHTINPGIIKLCLSLSPTVKSATFLYTDSPPFDEPKLHNKPMR